MAERVSAAQVDEWEAFERRYGPILVHERIDIGLASIAQMMSQTGKPLHDFLPTWWAWLDEDVEEPDEAGMMIATMRALSHKWQKRREEEVDEYGSGAGGGSGGSDHGGRYPAEGRARPGSGSD